MFIVAPSGSTKPAVDGEMRSTSFAQLSVAGKVALLELVENAVTRTVLMSRKKARGERRLQSLRKSDIVPNKCRSSTATQPNTNTPSAAMMSAPIFTMTL